jgi:4-methylaminobutanoate oxidase (formaldehyde-forming)
VHGDPADKAFIESGEWEVEIGARRYPATVSLRPMYDPAMQRVRA